MTCTECGKPLTGRQTKVCGPECRLASNRRYHRERRANNPEGVRKYFRAWSKNNRLAAAAHRRRYREKRANL